MTMSKSALTGQIIDVDWFGTPGGDSAPAPRSMRYECLVFRGKEPFIGTVVTEIPIEAWAKKYGYTVGIIHSSRIAMSEEKTELR
jgi:hypothetical protein